ncbi:MAG: ATP-binding protein [Gammaproteobacteria bacterium]|nr:ATP-binding protein [Gammaproteobacteria bacterium]
MSRFCHSIRSRLLLILLGVLLVVWVGAVLLGYQTVLTQIHNRADAQLSQTARLVTAQLSHELDESGLDLFQREVDMLLAVERHLHRYETELAIQIFGPDGSMVFRTLNSPVDALSRLNEGFEDRVHDGQQWRTYSYTHPRQLVKVELAENYRNRQRVSQSMAQAAMLPLLAALPVMGLLIWTGLGRGLAPLSKLAESVAERVPDSLHPFDPQRAPSEVKPLIGALNGLLERLSQALAKERDFTADAAHELRTPLAAIRTQAQVAMRAKEDAVQHHALGQVLAGVDRAAHLIEQLLVLARLDGAEQPSDALCTAPLRGTLIETLAELAPQADARQVQLELEEGGEIQVLCSEAELTILCRNLVENAIKYSPAGGRVELAVGSGGGGGWLRVKDSGPGITASERQRVFDRFYRKVGSAEPGSGLGLAIVQSICRRCGATIQLSDGHGLEVRVRFKLG